MCAPHAPVLAQFCQEGFPHDTPASRRGGGGAQAGRHILVLQVAHWWVWKSCAPHTQVLKQFCQKLKGFPHTSASEGGELMTFWQFWPCSHVYSTSGRYILMFKLYNQVCVTILHLVCALSANNFLIHIFIPYTPFIKVNTQVVHSEKSF